MRVVLDANVYVGAEVSPRGVCSKAIKIFTTPGTEFVLIATKKILDEVLDVLLRPKIMKVTQKNKAMIRQLVDDFAQIAMLVPDVAISTSACRDPKDVIYLAAASVAKADLIVSWDKDLLVLERYEETQIIKPDDFIKIAAQVLRT